MLYKFLKPALAFFFISACAQEAGLKVVMFAPYTSGSYSVQFVTDKNRAYPGQMSGGWGPQARPVMRNSNNELWYIIDSGPSVYSNTGLLYFRYLDSLGWNEVLSLNQISDIQQNVASVMKNDVIYSYGVKRTAPYELEECVLDTSNLSAGGTCSPVQVAGSNLHLMRLPLFFSQLGLDFSSVVKI